jgi:hypothetical protein
MILYLRSRNRDYGRRDPSRWPRGTHYPQKLALISPTSGDYSVCIVRSRTQVTGFALFLRSRLWIKFDVISTLWPVRYVEVGCVADVSEPNTSSTFKGELSKVNECSYDVDTGEGV